jgi:hypothetical protein
VSSGASKRVRINFVLSPLDGWEDLAAPEGVELDIDDLAPRIRMGREIWIVQAFQMLRRRGWSVHLSSSLDPDAVNVLHVDDLELTPHLWEHFLVTIRADRDPAFVGQHEIVQNRASVWSSSDLYIPHWPQPGLIPRDPGRGPTLRNLVYVGNPEQLDDALRAPSFKDRLAELGVSFQVRTDNWWDYRDADAVLAVRSGTGFYRTIKPASKLVNAWHAGCPAILGPEAAYRELREAPEDFLEAANPSDVIDAVTKLRNDPTLFRRMVDRGQDRGPEFRRGRVADQWAEVMTARVTPSFRRWLAIRDSNPRRLERGYLQNRARRRIWGTRAVAAADPYWKRGLSALRRHAAYLGFAGRARP